MDNPQLSILILDGESDLSLSVTRCLGQIPQLSIHTLSTEKFAPVRFSKHLSTFHYAQPGNADERIELIHNVAQKTKANILLPVADAMRFASKQFAGLSSISPIAPISPLELFDQVVDKWTLTQFMIEHQIPIPETVLLDGEGDLIDRVNELRPPFILKLTRGSAGQDIFAFDKVDDLDKFLEAKQGGKGRYLVQSFVEGHDIRCGVLCRDGSILAYTIHQGVLERKRRFGPPAGIRFIKSEGVFDVLVELVSKLNWTGIASVDLRYDIKEDRVKVLEINPRYWGSLLGALSAGVNFPYLASLSGLQIPFEQPDYEENVYLTGKATIEQSVKRIFGQSDVKFSVRDSSWNYGLADPVADLARISRSIFSKIR